MTGDLATVAVFPDELRGRLGGRPELLLA